MGGLGERPLSAPERTWAEKLLALRRRRSVFCVVSWGAVAFASALWIAIAATPELTATSRAGLVVLLAGIAGAMHGFVAGKRWWRGLAGILVLGLCTIQMMAIGFDQALLADSDALIASAFAAVVLMGWGHGLATLSARGRSRITRDTLREDLDDGLVLEFEGTTRELPPLLAAHLGRPHSRTDAGDQKRRVAILPRTSLVVSLDGNTMDRFIRVKPLMLAVPHCHALRVPLPNASLDDGASGTRKLCKRTLSLEERRELRTHARRLRRLEPTWTLLFVGAIGFCVLELGEKPWISGRLDVFLWTTLLVSAIAIHSRRWIAAGRLERDSSLRWVATVDDGKRLEPTPPVLEILPHSHVAWTEHGRPAPWRFTQD